MMFRSLALASDALVMQGQSVFEAYEDHIIMRTPDEPDYWHGNLVIMKHPPGDTLAQVCQFQTDFPDATHRTVIWDLPGLDPAPLAAALTHHGYEVGTSDTLTLDAEIRDARPPDGIVLRQLAGEADWTALTDLQAEVALEEGYDPKLHTLSCNAGIPRAVNRLPMGWAHGLAHLTAVFSSGRWACSMMTGSPDIRRLKHAPRTGGSGSVPHFWCRQQNGRCAGHQRRAPSSWQRRKAMPVASTGEWAFALQRRWSK